MMYAFNTVADVKKTANETSELISIDCYKIDPRYWREGNNELDCYALGWTNIDYIGEFGELNLPDDMPVYDIREVSDIEYCRLDNIDEKFADTGKHILFAVSEFDYAELD